MAAENLALPSKEYILNDKTYDFLKYIQIEKQLFKIVIILHIIAILLWLLIK